MARAYIVVARNDVPDNLLQSLDLWPNTSHRNYVTTPPGQTGYLTHYLLDGVNANVVLAGAGPITVTGDTYGLSAYLVGNVEVNPGNLAMTAVQAIAVAGRIEDRVATGLGLTLAEIDAILVAEAGGTTGLVAGNSTGTVEEVLRILLGERWIIQNAAAIADAVPNFDAAVNGEFVLRALVEQPESVRTGLPGGANRLPVRGRNSFVGKAIPTSVVLQDTTAAGITDTNFNDVLAVVDTGDLQRSAINGMLSKMASSTWTFNNPAFTYNGGATPATDIGGNNIGANWQGRAVTVFAADGTVIV
jgi:hypothetical protein